MKSKYINILNPKNLLLKAYEFKLEGYTTENDPMYFNYPKYVKNRETQCGLIRVQNKENDTKIESTDLRSCDVLDSISDYIYMSRLPDEIKNELNKTYLEKDPTNSKYENTYKLPIENNYTFDSKSTVHMDSNLYAGENSDMGKHILNMIYDAINQMHECVDRIQTSKYFIYNKKINKKTKVILIGDIHGGYHTFYRLLMRFIEYGYIIPGTLSDDFKFISGEKQHNGRYNPDVEYTDFKVSDDHVIILCGDVLDRGGFSFEILYLISNLILNSNSKNDVRFIYNRGNHETKNQYTDKSSGAYYEIINKLGTTEDDILELLDEFYSYCPVATILHYCSQRIFVCHGGIPIDLINGNCNDAKPAEINMDTEFVGVFDDIGHQIMWNDFTMGDKCIWSEIRDRKDHKNTNKICEIGTEALDKFMEHHQIDMIIRGHQDSYANTVLFTRNDKVDFTPVPADTESKLFVSVSHQITAKNETIKSVLKNNEFPVINNDNSIHGPIATFDLNKFKKQDNYKKVITISTNTGYDRPLTYDSFLLIEPDIPKQK